MAGADDIDPGAWDPTKRRLLDSLLAAQGGRQTSTQAPSTDEQGASVASQDVGPPAKATDATTTPSDDGGTHPRRYVPPADDGQPSDPNEIEITPSDVEEAEARIKSSNIAQNKSGIREVTLAPISVKAPQKGRRPALVTSALSPWSSDNSTESSDPDSPQYRGLFDWNDRTTREQKLADIKRFQDEASSDSNEFERQRQDEALKSEIRKQTFAGKQQGPDVDVEDIPTTGRQEEQRAQQSMVPGWRDSALTPLHVFDLPDRDDLQLDPGISHARPSNILVPPDGLARLRSIQNASGAPGPAQTPDAISGGIASGQLVPREQAEQAVHAAAVNAAGAATVNASAPERSFDDIRQRAGQIIAGQDARAAQVQLDPSSGQPMAPSTQDLLYQASQRLDDGYQRIRHGLALEQATAEERARQGLSLQQRLMADVDHYDSLRRQYFDQAVAARQRALQSFPNPDTLLGGKGSWSRAFALALATSGIPGDAQLINSTLQMQMDSQQARFQQARFAEQNAVTNSEAATFMVAAARDRLSEQLRTVAAQTSVPAIQAQYLRTAGELDQKNAEELGKLATVKANSDLKDAQMASAGWHFYKGQWFPPPGQGHAVGGGIGSGASAGGLGSTSAGFGAESMAPKDRERAVWVDPNRPPVLFTDKESADKFRTEFARSRTTVRLASGLQTMLDGYKGDIRDLWKYSRTDQGAWIKTTAQYLAANEAQALGSKSKGMVDYLAGDNDDPGSAVLNKDSIKSSLGAIITANQEKVNDSLRTQGYDPKRLKDLGTDVNMPEAPKPAPRKSIQQELASVGATPIVTKDGSVPYPTADEMVHSIDAGYESGISAGDNPVIISSQLNAARARLEKAYSVAQGKLLKLIQDKVTMEDPRRKNVTAVINAIGTAQTHIDEKLKVLGTDLQRRSDAQKLRERQEEQRNRAVNTPRQGANSI